MRCHTFISESTFGLPVYRWAPQTEIFEDINAWWSGNKAAGKASLLLCYALGKAQRILAGVDASCIGPASVAGRARDDARLVDGHDLALFTDYTFAVWRNGELVPFCKAYSRLTDEIRQVDAFVRAHTREQFGPVRVVDPELVFEIGFEGIARSTRHKSGVAVRFPRMLRWRQDKRAEEADALERLLALLPGAEGAEGAEAPNVTP